MHTRQQLLFSYFKTGWLIHAPSIHLSDRRLDVLLRFDHDRSPAPTSDTHSNRPSFFPPFPSTTLLHRTVRFSPDPSQTLCSSILAQLREAFRTTQVDVPPGDRQEHGRLPTPPRIRVCVCRRLVRV